MPPKSADLLADVAVTALVVAHGTDADLDVRESRAVVEHLAEAAEALVGHEVKTVALSRQVEEAVQRYGRLTVPDFEALVAGLTERLGAEQRAAAFAILVGVAEADGVVTTMERTLLRHVAEAWGVDSL